MYGSYGSLFWWWNGLDTPPVFSTLPGINRFQSGIGGGADGLVKIREDLEGGWFPMIHVGHYYIGTEEHYLYSKKGEYSFTVTSSGTIGTVVVSDLLKDPTEIGPIRIRRQDTGEILQRVCSPLRAYRPITFSGTDPKTASTTGLLVNLVSHPSTGILLSVPATGDIISNEDYVYNPLTSTVYIRNNAPPSLYATYLVDELDPALIRQEEVIIIDTDRKARVQFTNVSMASGYVPLIRKPTPAGTIIASGVAVSGNAITFFPSGQISSGDIVAVEYYVNNSFTAIVTGDSLIVQHFVVASSGTYVVEYETGGEWYDTSLLSSGSVDYIQLNPILNQRESGFLYVVDSFEPPLTARRIRLTLSNPTPTFNTLGSPYVMIATTVFDSEGEPIPGVNINVSASGAPGSLVLAGQSTLATNGLGQILHTFTPAGTGLVTITSVVQSNGLSGSIAFLVRGTGLYESQEEQRLGKLILHMEEVPYLNNLMRLNAYYCYSDGSPFQANDGTDVYSTTVVFSSRRSQFFTLDGLPAPEPSVTINQDGIASILVEPVPGDIIRAYVETSTPGRIRYAMPVRIAEIEQEIQ